MRSWPRVKQPFDVDRSVGDGRIHKKKEEEIYMQAEMETRVEPQKKAVLIDASVFSFPSGKHGTALISRANWSFALSRSADGEQQ